MLGFTRVPVGELEGRLAQVIQADQLDYDDPRCLVRAVLGQRLSGVQLVQLVSAPWGDHRLDIALAALGGDQRTCGITVWDQRKPSGSWPAVPCWWVLDLSDILAHPITAPGLVQRVSGLPLVPQPAEILLENPHAQTSAAHLDELTTRLDCQVGWVYLDRDNLDGLDQLELAVSRAAGSWGVRVR